MHDPPVVTFTASNRARPFPLGILAGQPFTKPVHAIARIARLADGRTEVWIKGSESQPVHVDEPYEVVERMLRPGD